MAKFNITIRQVVLETYEKVQETEFIIEANDIEEATAVGKVLADDAEIQDFVWNDLSSEYYSDEVKDYPLLDRVEEASESAHAHFTASDVL